jgi:hypothetical protein
MKNPRRFYTYAYLREDRTPYYIGKGQGGRIYSNQRNIKPPKDKSRIIFLKQNLTEEESLNHERYLIAVFGRIDLGTGILRNKSDGGIAPTNLSPETRKKMSEARKGRIITDETRKKIGQGNKGKKVSEEVKKKLREMHKGKKLSTETKLKISKSLIGNKFAKGNKVDRKIVDRLTEQRKKNKWWNNGTEQKFCPECPIGWKSGRLPIKGNYSKPGEKNPRAKIWEITFSDGKIEIINCLAKWCRENNYNTNTVRFAMSENRPYKNIVKIVSLGEVHKK